MAEQESKETTKQQEMPVKRNEDGSELSLSSKENIRRQLEEDMRTFLAAGGSVQHVDPNVTADPPKKPVSNYGSRPI